MMREARNRVEGEQKGSRKLARSRKAGVNLFTALEPTLGSNPIFRMRKEAFGPNKLEDCGCAHSRVASWPPSLQEKLVNTGCNQNSHAFRRSTSSQIVVETIELLGEATSEVLPWSNGKNNCLTTF
eukprot:4322899-Pleurochrysis_carterae.AAC.2